MSDCGCITDPTDTTTFCEHSSDERIIASFTQQIRHERRLAVLYDQAREIVDDEEYNA